LLARDAATRAWRWVWIGLAAAAAFNVALLNLGRTGQLVLVCLAFYLGYASQRWRGVLAVLAACAALTLAQQVPWAQLSAQAPPAQDRAKLALDEALAWQPDLPSQTSVGMRLEFYRTSLALIARNPVFGSGTGSVAKAYAEEVAGTDMVRTTNPHNEYLNLAIQLGATGVLAMVALFYMIWRFASRLPSAREQHLARGLVITFAVGCLFNSLLLDHVEGLWFAWATGLLFAGFSGRLLARTPSP
jgi:O-antigen ligase